MEKIRQGNFIERILQPFSPTLPNVFRKSQMNYTKFDDAMKAGYGWEHGPFQIWDAIGVEKGLEIMKAEGKEPAAWVNEMLETGKKSFLYGKRWKHLLL